MASTVDVAVLWRNWTCECMGLSDVSGRWNNTRERLNLNETLYKGDAAAR
jgi:hypothetical protein